MTRNGRSQEESPLLGPRSRRPDAASKSSHQITLTSSFIVALYLIASSILELSGSFIDPAFGEIQEGIICRQHYNNVADSATDPRCKGKEVQSDISMLQAIEMTFASTPAVFLSLLYGMGAGKFGR
ncbi:hypothetical protein QQS21_011691 [Conoideocrella luteorostrata]|uniref:Uncharacterized protein n=1 Tax=Conoideocrella luteorostrata TaxID=1105319 RepID=A0AAJ0FVM0_9HYPO|nr:hypothetical protein QQS21_011691 [Conoideocrella luteorostrata]